MILFYHKVLRDSLFMLISVATINIILGKKITEPETEPSTPVLNLCTLPTEQPELAIHVSQTVRFEFSSPSTIH